MKGINLGASPEPFLPPQAAGYRTRKGIKGFSNSYIICRCSVHSITDPIVCMGTIQQDRFHDLLADKLPMNGLQLIPIQGIALRTERWQVAADLE